MKNVNIMKMTSMFLCLVMLVAAATGCAGPTATPSASSQASQEPSPAASSADSSAPAAEPLAIQCLCPNAETTGYTVTMNAVIDKYKETHPDFSFTNEIISDGNAYLQKLKILISSNALPDWFFGDPDTLLMGVRDQGILTNIGDLIKELGVEDRFCTITTQYPTFDDGTLYLIGLGANTEYIWYHKDLFAKAGITEPPKTFDEFFEDCEKLKAQGITPVGCSKEGFYPLLRFTAMVPFRMTGNQFINDARTGKTKFNSEVGLAAGEFTRKLGTYFQDGWAGVDISTMVNYFLAGNCSMCYYSTSSGLRFFSDENYELKDDISYFTLPALGSSDATAPTDYFANPGKGIAILQSGMNDQMKDFVKFFVENFGDLAVENHFISGIKPTSTEGMPKLYQDLYNNFLNVNTFAACWDVRLDTSTTEVMKREVVNLALGDITPEEWANLIDDAVAQYAPDAFS